MADLARSGMKREGFLPHLVYAAFAELLNLVCKWSSVATGKAVLRPTVDAQIVQTWSCSQYVPLARLRFETSQNVIDTVKCLHYDHPLKTE